MNSIQQPNPLSQQFETRQNKLQQLFAQPVRLLAPMEGLTDPLMRQILTQIASDLGRPYDWSISEFIRVTQHVLPAHVFIDMSLSYIRMPRRIFRHPYSYTAIR